MRSVPFAEAKGLRWTKAAYEATLGPMVIFGKSSLWIVIGLMTLVIAGALVAAGNVVIAAALVILVVVGGYYALSGETNY
jgi:hypothetical protein